MQIVARGGHQILRCLSGDAFAPITDLRVPTPEREGSPQSGGFAARVTSATRDPNWDPDPKLQELHPPHIRLALTAASLRSLVGYWLRPPVPLTDDARGGFPVARCDIFNAAGLCGPAGVDDTFESSDDFAIKMGEAK